MCNKNTKFAGPLASANSASRTINPLLNLTESQTQLSNVMFIHAVYKGDSQKQYLFDSVPSAKPQIFTSACICYLTIFNFCHMKTKKVGAYLTTRSRERPYKYQVTSSGNKGETKLSYCRNMKGKG